MLEHRSKRQPTEPPTLSVALSSRSWRPLRPTGLPRDPLAATQGPPRCLRPSRRRAPKEQLKGHRVETAHGTANGKESTAVRELVTDHVLQ